MVVHDCHGQSAPDRSFCKRLSIIFCLKEPGSERSRSILAMTNVHDQWCHDGLILSLLSIEWWYISVEQYIYIVRNMVLQYFLVSNYYLLCQWCKVIGSGPFVCLCARTLTTEQFDL